MNSLAFVGGCYFSYDQYACIHAIDKTHKKPSETRFAYAIWPFKYTDLYCDLKFYILRVMWKRSMIIAFSNAPREIKTRFANLENAKKRYPTRRHNCNDIYLYRYIFVDSYYISKSTHIWYKARDNIKECRNWWINVVKCCLPTTSPVGMIGNVQLHAHGNVK